MSGSVDERIVEMEFQGTSFFSGVKNAVDSLTRLKTGLNGLKGSEEDVNNLDEAGKKFSLSGMANGLSSLGSKFSALGIIGTTALATIANKAVETGLEIVHAFIIDPVKEGLETYETKINAIKTILSNTAAAGTTLAQIQVALANLNQYANLTVYNFGQMASAIGTFTAAGVGLNASVQAIKGIANLAAFSGSNAEQAQRVMQEFSESLAQNKVQLRQWQSAVNAGIGGKVFQTALIDTARAQGVAIDSMIKKAGSFRASLNKGWLDSKVLTQTLAIFSGTLSDQQLKAMGYTSAEAKLLSGEGKTALQAATQVRTISALFQDLKEEAATAFAAIFTAVIGNIGDATKTLSALHSTLENLITTPIYAIARVLQAFTNLGGRDLLIQSVVESFQLLAKVVGIVGQAFHEVFPPGGGPADEAMVKFVIVLQDFVQHLKLTATTAADLKTIFVAIFSVVKIVIDVVKDLASGFTHVGTASQNAGGGFLSLLTKIAQWVIDLRKAIESGTVFANILKTIGQVITLPVKLVGLLIGALGGFGNAATKAATAGSDFISKFLSKVSEAFSKVADAIGQGIQSGNFQKVTDILQQILIGGVLLSIRKLINKFSAGIGEGESKGLLDTIKESFEGLTSTLQSMQTRLKAGLLKEIAISIALLAGSLFILSLINVKDLTQALSAITILFANLMLTLTAVTKGAASTGVVKMLAIGVALNLMATAILILAGAVAILAQFKIGALATAISTIAALLAELVGAVALIGANAKGTVVAASAMVIMAVALNILALAVKQLGKLDLGTLAKGIGAIAALLLILGLFTQFSGDTLISTSVSLVILGAALLIITKAVKELGSQDLSVLAKGISSVAAVLAILILAMLGMDSALPGAAATVIISAALLLMAKALKSMGAETWGAIGRALVLLAGSLLIIAGAMILMTEALPGAAALVVVAGALAILTPILIAMGSLSWETIGKGLATLVGLFAVIGVAGLVLAPVVPVLLLLGLAITLIGAGILAAGAGVGVFAIGLTALAVAITASGVAILSFVKNILSLIPAFFAEFGIGIIAFAKSIASAGGALTAAFATLLVAILNAIIKVAPVMAKAFQTLIDAILPIINKDSGPILKTMTGLLLLLLTTIAKSTPKFVDAGVSIIVNVIAGIAKAVGRLVAAATSVVVAWIVAIGKGAVKIVAAGITMVINLINGIAKQINTDSPKLDAAVDNLARAIITGIVKGIVSLAGTVADALLDSVKNAIKAAKNWLLSLSPSKRTRDELGIPMIQGVAVGINQASSLVSDAMVNVGSTAISSLKATLSNLNDVVNENMNLQPRITPVVDLSEAKKGFTQLGALSKNQLINAGASTSSAASISAVNAAAAVQAGLVGTAPTVLEFNQYNTSPTALSTIDIYRQTKNQISAAKGVLVGHAHVG